jgi:hypothetical protein
MLVSSGIARTWRVITFWHFGLRADSLRTQCQGQVAIRDNANRPIVLDDDHSADIVLLHSVRNGRQGFFGCSGDNASGENVVELHGCVPSLKKSRVP